MIDDGRGLHELAVTALALKELGVGAGLHDAALLDNGDEVGRGNGGEPMGNDQSRAPGEDGEERLADEGFALGVEGTGGFVEDKDVGLGEDGTGNADALPLSATEEGAPVADRGVVALRQLEDEVVGVGYAGSLLNLAVGGLRHAVGYIVADGIVEKEGVLRHYADVPAEGRGEIGLDGATVDEYLAGGGFMETHEEVGKGGFAGTRTAHQGHSGATRHGEVDAMQDFGAGEVAEMQVAELDAGGEPGEGSGLGCVGLGLRLVEEGLQAIGAGLSFLDLRDGGGKLFGGRYHEDEHHDVRNKELGGDARIAPDDHGGAEEEDAYHHAVAQKVADGRGEVDTPQHPCAEACITHTSLAETAVGEFDSGVGLDDFETDDGLLHERHDGGAALLQLDRLAPQTVRDARDDKGHHWQHAEDEERELDTDVEEHGGVEQDADSCHEELLERAKDALVVFGHIAGKAGKDVALAMGAVVR